MRDAGIFPYVYMKNLRFIALGIIGALMVPAILQAKTLNAPYRSCVQQAMYQRETEYLNIAIEYHRAVERGVEQRRSDYVDAWNFEDDKDIRKAAAEREKEYNKLKKEAAKVRDSRNRDTDRAYTAAKKECKALHNGGSTSSRSSSSRSSVSSAQCIVDSDCPAAWDCSGGRCEAPDPQYDGTRCYNSNNCRPGYRCTIDDGECLSPCPPGADYCIQVCQGRCVLNNI